MPNPASDSETTVETAANDIAAQLQETHPPAILQIRRIIEQIGIEATYTHLQKT